MSNNEERFPVSAEELIEAEVQEPKPETESSEPNSQRVKPWHVAVLILLVAIVGVATLGYLGWNTWLEKNQQLSSMQQQQTNLEQQLDDLRQQLQRLSSTDSNLQQRVDQSMSDLRAMVVSTAQRLNREADQTENRLPLEEALALTRLAEQRLFLDNNAQVAVSYLLAADQALKPLDTAAVLPLREQIAKDVLSLRNAQSVDSSGVYFQLEAIADYVNELTWQPRPVQSEPIEPEQNPVEGFWQGMKNIVVVKRLDVPVQAQPLLTDFEQWRQQTLLLLGQAQLALLAQNQALFETVLEQLSGQLSIMSSQFSFTAAQATISELQSLNLSPTWPDISTSAQAIQAYIAQQNAPEEDEQ